MSLYNNALSSIDIVKSNQVRSKKSITYLLLKKYYLNSILKYYLLKY